MTNLTITASARNWMVLRQTHLAAVFALKESGNELGAMAGAILGIGFTKAVINTANPPVTDLKDGADDELPITITVEQHLFSGVFNSLDLAYATLSVDDGNPLPEQVATWIESAWLVFKTEALLAEVG